MAALFRLEQTPTPETLAEVVKALKAWLAAPAQRSLRHAFAEWIDKVLLPLRLPGVEIPEVRDLDELETMLAERVVEWAEQWKQQGLQQGHEEERQRALATDRRLLVRLSERRFGQNWTGTLQKLLETLDDPEQVVTIGEWIIDSPDGKKLIERVEKLLN